MTEPPYDKDIQGLLSAIQECGDDIYTLGVDDFIQMLGSVGEGRCECKT